MPVFLIHSSDDVRANVREFSSNSRILINEEMDVQGYKLLINKEMYGLIYKGECIFYRIVILVVVGSSPISHPTHSCKKARFSPGLFAFWGKMLEGNL
jgi:hypothetical protein